MANSFKPYSRPKSKGLTEGLRGLLQGRVGFAQATREGFRRGRAAFQSRRERAQLDELGSQPARLQREFQHLSAAELLDHFRNRSSPKFFPGLETEDIWSIETGNISSLDFLMFTSPVRAILEHRWPLLGFGEKDFGREINWHRDPLSGRIWPLDYHSDIPLWHNDGSDIRALWELNRLGHLVALGRAYVVIRASDPEWKALWKENRDADEEFFLQVKSWYEQNPLGRGANWACAMEVALRAINLLTAFTLFKSSPQLNEERLLLLLKMFDEHGAHIRRNLEFSHITTSNHYLADVAGLLWLGIMLPELQSGAEWREWALAELLREMDKQILDDGADYEGATAYHRFVVELFLYSFLLCRANEISIPDKYWLKLHAMLAYLRAIMRPDGTLPLIGDHDGSCVFAVPTESLWVLGEMGRDAEAGAASNEEPSSQAFPHAGTYVLRHDHLELLFNASSPQKGRPTSHRHNDALSVEISAHGRAFIVDPGTYVYTADLHERHLFRSTSYHSTIMIDDVEQNTIREDAPFVIGIEASVRVLSWETSPERDRVVAEHTGYERLTKAITHRRAVTLNKLDRWWLIEDEIFGKGEHKAAARFHFDAGLEVDLFGQQGVMAHDVASGARLCVLALTPGEVQPPTLEAQFVSRHYGSKLPSITARWSLQVKSPSKLCWAIVPVCAGDNLEERMTLDFGRWTLD